MLGLSLGLGLSSPIPTSGGPAEGPELWPQPEFAASTGLTLSTFDGDTPTVHDGVLDFDTGGFCDGKCEATALETLTTGTYRIVAQLASGDGVGGYVIVVSEGGTGSEVTFDGADLNEETHDTPLAVLGNQTIAVQNNGSPIELTKLSVIKIA